MDEFIFSLEGPLGTVWAGANNALYFAPHGEKNRKLIGYVINTSEGRQRAEFIAKEWVGLAEFNLLLLPETEHFNG